MLYFNMGGRRTRHRSLPPSLSISLTISTARLLKEAWRRQAGGSISGHKLLFQGEEWGQAELKQGREIRPRRPDPRASSSELSLPLGAVGALESSWPRAQSDLRRQNRGVPRGRKEGGAQGEHRRLDHQVLGHVRRGPWAPGSAVPATPPLLPAPWHHLTY